MSWRNQKKRNRIRIPMIWLVDWTTSSDDLIGHVVLRKFTVCSWRGSCCFDILNLYRWYVPSKLIIKSRFRSEVNAHWYASGPKMRRLKSAYVLCDFLLCNFELKSGIWIWEIDRFPSMNFDFRSSESSNFQIWHVPRDDIEHKRDESIEKFILNVLASLTPRRSSYI